MIEVSQEIRIPEEELLWTFARSGGPGGQNVNKVASKALLRWNIRHSPSLTEPLRQRVMARLASRITTEGDLLISSQLYRDQERNKEDCLAKFVAILLEASHVPKTRKPTKPTRSSQRRRITEKRLKSATKESRRKPGPED